MNKDVSRAPPEAVLKPRRKISPWWLLPLGALLFSGWLGYRTWLSTGVTVTVRFTRGYGLKAGDEVRHRGIAIGVVREVSLAPGGDGIRVLLDLRREALRFVQQGASFWIVRPRISLAGVSGVETLFGIRYVAALPGDGARRHQFTGLEEPRVVDHVDPGDLEIVLESRERGNLEAGTAVTYREVPIGVVLAVNLAGDAGSVEARVHIEQPYVPLIRRDSRFFFASGVGAQWGTRWLWMEFKGKLARIGLGGTVAVATPPDGGPIARTGQRFLLAREPEQEWLAWRPAIAVGSSQLPSGTRVPRPVRARLSWKAGFFKRNHSRSGWLLATERGVLGPLDLLAGPRDAVPGSVRLEAAGTVVTLGSPGLLAPGVGLLSAHVPGPVFPLPDHIDVKKPVDCLVFGDRPQTPLALSARHLRPAGDVWVVDGSMVVDPRWHGGSVVCRGNGEWVGVLVMDDESARVVPVALPPVSRAPDSPGGPSGSGGH